MTWLWRYRVRLYLRDSVWVLPSLGIPAAMLALWVVHEIESVLGWESNLTPEAARTVLIALASSLFTFIVFVSSAMLLALQLASAQLTPRIIAVVFRDPVFKYSLTLFVFTFTFLVAAVIRIDESVPLFTARLSSYSCMVSLAVFFFMIDHVGKALRPNEALRSVALKGRRVIESAYPHALTESHIARADADMPAVEATATVLAPADGVVLACDVAGIVSLARRFNCIVELVPQIGDFVAVGAPLFRVLSEGPPPPANELRQTVAIGHERTMEQDPCFVFRIIVDIACKALSPAINDPTTAVLAIDQLHHLLRHVGFRRLEDERIRDAAGRVRLIYRTPNWEDFVHLAVTEIRQYGRESIQITRRLRAMLENLVQTLPEPRLAMLRQELELLKRSAARFFPEPGDLALAAISDSQGVGGRTEENGGVRGRAETI